MEPKESTKMRYDLSLADQKYKEKDYLEALSIYERYCEDSDYAAFQLAYIFYTGTGIKRDLQLGLEWFLKAAEMGNVTAMFNIAKIYETNKSFGKSFDEVIAWAEKACIGGNTEAMTWLARRLWKKRKKQEEDFDVASAEKKILYWVEKAAEKKDPAAYDLLGFFHEKGYMGFEYNLENLEKAKEWYERGANEYPDHEKKFERSLSRVRQLILAYKFESIRAKRKNGEKQEQN